MVTDEIESEIEIEKRKPSKEFMRMLTSFWLQTPKRARAQARGKYNKEQQLSKKV